jgi:hypothetical protein
MAYPQIDNYLRPDMCVVRNKKNHREVIIGDPVLVNNNNFALLISKKITNREVKARRSDADVKPDIGGP